MTYSKRCIVTGAAGFIGSALARLLLKETEATVLVVDKLTYAGVPESLKEVGLNPVDLSSSNPRLSFLKADICDQEAMDRAFESFRPDTIFHLAAESHVDRSIDGPGEFIRANVVGTATLLQAALKWWKKHPDFVFQHISTDEVYGTLGATGFFTEKTEATARGVGKLMNGLGWRPLENFETGVRKTVRWHLGNEWWWWPIRRGRYAGQRLGAGK